MLKSAGEEIRETRTFIQGRSKLTNLGVSLKNSWKSFLLSTMQLQQKKGQNLRQLS